MRDLYINSNTGELVCQEEIELHDGRRDWRKRKKMSIQVAKLMAAYDPERAAKIRGCGTYLEFIRTPEGKDSLRHANFCRERLCPMCQWRRSIKLRAQAEEIYKIEIERGYKHVFVTLTWRNCPGEQLVTQVSEMIQAAQRWKRTKLYKNAFRGSYRALEITYNEKRNDYHPHLHFLMTVDGNYFDRRNPDYVTTDKLIESWKDASRLDYNPSVAIEAIYTKEGQTMTGALAEISKYPAKTAEVRSSAVLQHIDYALRGRRLIQWGGITAKIRAELGQDDVESGNLIQITEAEGGDALEKIVYVWRYGFYIPLDYKRVDELAKENERD